MKQVQEISLASIAEMRKKVEANPEVALRMNAVTRVGADEAAMKFSGAIETQHVFSNEVEAGKITNQKSSGRCWLFAAMNTMRVEVMKRCGLEDFELSQAYMMFWDKLEKCNFFLESILDTADEPQDSRIIHWLLTSPYGDGGQWDMVVSLVEKYGVVPKRAMPESFSSSNSGKMNDILTVKAREYAMTLRNACHEGKNMQELQAMKQAMVEETYRLLCIFLGTPPDEFTFECRNKEKAFFREANLTGKTFYDKYVGTVLHDYVSLINAPTKDKPYHQTFTVSYLGNVVGGQDIKYLNLPAESLKRAASAQILDGQPVWFGCDVGKMLDGDHGIMSMGTFDYSLLLQTDFALTKAQRLDYGESCMTHAMVLTGVNLVDGKPNRWKVENSWGDAKGDKGWYVMGDSWFDQFTYQVVVNKSFLTDEERADLQKAPISLQPWDPMGSLAK